MTAAAVIDLRPAGWNRLAAKLRDDGGLGLVELLIALLVLNIGIFATVAAFSSGALAIRRASHVSTAAAIADQEMELLRDTPYLSIQPQPATVWQNSPDGRQYTVQVDVQDASGAAYAGSSGVALVTVTVRDVADNNKELVKSSSTFSQCAQDMTATACGGS